MYFFRIIFSKVRSMLGGRVRLILSGGAPLSPDTHEQINACLCVNVIQGYGLTESTSCATVMDRKCIISTIPFSPYLFNFFYNFHKLIKISHYFPLQFQLTTGLLAEQEERQQYVILS